MSEPELATKAPESDAMEDIPTSSPTTRQPSPTIPINNTTSETQPSAISNTDSTAQSGPTMGDHCTTDRPAPLDTSSSGTIQPLGGADTYISKPADYPSTPAKLLLLLTGGTGIHSPNNQLQADRFAQAGYLVLMPDQFAGDPAPNSTNRVTSPSLLTDPDAGQLEAQTPGTPSLLDRIKLGFADTAKSFMLDMWLARQTPELVLPRLLAVLRAAHDEYADAIAHGGGIYGVGYCFGARYILMLGAANPYGNPALMGKSPLEEIGGVLPGLGSLPAMLGGGKKNTAVVGGEGGGGEGGGAVAEAQPAIPQVQREEPLIKVGAIAHGTLVTREDVGGVKVPMCVVAVEDDPLFPGEVLEYGRKVWGASHVECRVEVFSGVPHGFAVVGEYDDRKIGEEQERAWGVMRGWLDGR